MSYPDDVLKTAENALFNMNGTDYRQDAIHEIARVIMDERERVAADERERIAAKADAWAEGLDLFKDKWSRDLMARFASDVRGDTNPAPFSPFRPASEPRTA